MSRTEYKTESKVNTATKFNSERSITTKSEYGYTSKEEKQVILNNLDGLNSDQLKALKKGLGVKSKATTKAGLKRAIEKQLEKDLGSTKAEKPKTLDNMNNKELRKIAKSHGIPHSGKNANNTALKRNIKAHLKEKQIEENESLSERRLAVLENEHWKKTMAGASAEDLHDIEKEMAILQKQQKATEENERIERRLAVLEDEHWEKTMAGASAEDLHDLEKEISKLQKQQREIDQKEPITVKSQKDAWTDADDDLEIQYNIAEESTTDLKRTEVADPDTRGYRGNKAENDVIDVFQDKGWKVEERPSNGHDMVLSKKNAKLRYFDVKEIDETVDSGDGTEKGRVQIDRAELQRFKDWEKETDGKAFVIININYDDKSEKWKKLTLPKASKLMKGKADPVKIPFTEIEKLPDFKEMEKKPEYIGGTAPASVNISQVKTHNGRILPDQPFDYPESWKDIDGKIQHEQAKRREYREENIIPFHNKVNKNRSANELFDIDDLRSKVKTVDIAVEKQQLLSDAEKKQNLVIGSFGGQNIQAKTDQQIFKGLYNQKGEKDEIHQFYKADLIKVDTDDTGHYIAYMNEIYTGHTAKKIVFGNKEGKINKLKANKFLGKQILSSLSYQRNKAISDALKDSLSDVPIKKELVDARGVFSPLAYRNSSGVVKDLSVSEEQLAIANTVLNAPVNVIVDLVDSDENIRFIYKGEDLDERFKPTVSFIVTGGDVKPLDSDTLLVFSVDRMNLEPDAVQNMLEALYQQGWINYPRADTLKAEDEPIYLLRDIDSFQGTEQEKHLLKIIDESDKAFKQGKPYLQNGYWILEQGATNLKSNAVKLVDEVSFYTDEGFDISIEKGLSPLDLTKYLVENDITTPATRTAIISAMKEAGVLSLDKDRKYQLDRRGIYFAGAYGFLAKHKIETSIELKKKITAIKPSEKTKVINKRIKQIASIVNNYDIIDRKEMKYFVKKQSEKLLREQNDLSVLDGY